MQSINVKLQDRSYTIQIQNDLRLRLHEILGSKNSGQQWIIFSQKPIFKIYGEAIESMLREHNFEVKHILLENSENAKLFFGKNSLNVTIVKLFSKFFLTVLGYF